MTGFEKKKKKKSYILFPNWVIPINNELSLNDYRLHKIIILIPSSDSKDEDIEIGSNINKLDVYKIKLLEDLKKYTKMYCYRVSADIL